MTKNIILNIDYSISEYYHKKLEPTNTPVFPKDIKK